MGVPLFRVRLEGLRGESEDVKGLFVQENEKAKRERESRVTAIRLGPPQRQKERREAEKKRL